ncbi:MAG TPA: glycosyl hydrolase family 28 protein [Acidobacteriaceae bacterium]
MLRSLNRRRRNGCIAVAALLAILLLGRHALAQDTRHVTEPVIPSACTVLTADQSSYGVALPDLDETKPDTLRIQRALDHCKPGHAVELKPSGNRDAFLAGPLELRTGVTLLIDRGATLFGSRNPRDYDVAPGLCGTITEKKYPYTQGLSGHGCKPLIGGTDVADAAIMGDGIIDGRRNAKLLGQIITWEDLAETSIKGWPTEYLSWARGVGITPHVDPTPPALVGLQNNPRLINLVHCDNFILYRIQLRNSPNFAVSYAGGNGFTVWSVLINQPRDALNGDGINLGQPWPEVSTDTTNITIAHTFIYAGDDNLAIKSRTGSHTSNVSVLHNHFYAGHGIGTGSSTSGGISNIRVSDLTLDGTATGIHMKSNNKLGGLVRDVEFSDICIRSSPNPISIGTHSGSNGHHEVDAAEANKPPQYLDIRLSNILLQGPGRVAIDGLDAAHRLGLSFRNVIAEQPTSIHATATHADIALEGTNLTLAGDDLNLTGAPSQGTSNRCDGRYLPFPVPIATSN